MNIYQSLLKNIIGYLDTKLQIVELDITEKAVEIAIKLFILAILGTLASLALIFLSIALCIYLNTVFDSNIIGFMLTGFLYLIFFIFVFLTRYAKVWRNLIYKAFKEDRNER